MPEPSLSYMEPAHRMTRVTFIGATCAVILLNGISIHGGPLYQCREDSGALTYTDNTAQLGHCIPLQSLPVQVISAVPSIPSYTPHPATPPFSEQVTDFPMEPPPVPAVTMPSHNLNSAGMSPESETNLSPSASGAQPCHPGFNPLNPLSAPPCQVREPSQATTQTPLFPNDMLSPAP